MKRKRAKGQLKPRVGFLPGQYKRRALVTVEKIDKDGAGYELTVPHNYIVLSHRLDNQYKYTIEYQGVKWEIPGRVMEAMTRHRDSMIKEAKRRTALDHYEKAKAKADREQEEAEEERALDLKGQ
jgi:hypothetical protein